MQSRRGILAFVLTLVLILFLLPSVPAKPQTGKFAETTTTPKNYKVTWYTVYETPSHLEYIISVQNLEDTNRDFSLDFFLNENSWNDAKEIIVKLEEWKNQTFYKSTPYYVDFTTYPARPIFENATNPSCEEMGYNIYNLSHCRFTDQVIGGYNATPYQKPSWKETKGRSALGKQGGEYKDSYGVINIPKFNSKDKGDTDNGTKWFHLVIDLPIQIGEMSGKVGFYVEGDEAHPYFNESYTSSFCAVYGATKHINQSLDYTNYTLKHDLTNDINVSILTHGTLTNYSYKFNATASATTNSVDEAIDFSNMNGSTCYFLGDNEIIFTYDNGVDNITKPFFNTTEMNQTTFDNMAWIMDCQMTDQLCDYFDDSDITNDPTWEVQDGTWVATNQYGVHPVNDGTAPAMWTPFNMTGAGFKVSFRGYRTASIGHDLWGVITTAMPIGSSIGYITRWDKTDDDIDLRKDWGSLLLDGTSYLENTWYDIEFTLSRGVLELLIEGVSQGTAADTTYEPSDLPVFFVGTGDTADLIRIDDLSVVNYLTNADNTEAMSLSWTYAPEAVVTNVITVSLISPEDDTNTTNTTLTFDLLPNTSTGFTNLSISISNNSDNSILTTLNLSEVQNDTINTIEANITTDGSYTVFGTVWNNESTPLTGASSNFTIRRDTTPPENITIQHPENTTIGKSVWFNITGVDALLEISSVWYSLDNGSNTSMTNSTGNWNAQNTSMSDGLHYINIYLNDTLGNENATTPTRYFTVDATPPTGTINYPDNSTYYGNFTPTLNATFGETVNWTWYNINGTANQSYTENTTNLTVYLEQIFDGTHEIKVYANDSFGNEIMVSVFFTVKEATGQCTGNPTDIHLLQLNLTTETNYTTAVTGTIGVQLTITDADNQNVTDAGHINTSTSYMDICVKDSRIGDTLDVDITYHSETDYAQSFWYLRNIVISTTTNEVLMALMNTTIKADAIFRVIDAQGNTADGHIVSLQRYIYDENAYITMRMGLTNLIGETLIVLEPNDAYYVPIVANGEGVALKSFDPMIITQTTTTLYLDPTVRGYYYETYGQISHSCTYNNATLTLTCTMVDNTGLSTVGRLVVWEKNPLNDTLVSDQIVSGSSVTIVYTLPNNDSLFYFQFGNQYSPPGQVLEAGYLEGPEHSRPYGNTGVLGATFLSVTMGFLGWWNPPVGILFFIIGFMASSILGLFEVDNRVLVPLVVIAAVVVWRLRKK